MKTIYRIHFLCWMVSLAIGISAQNQVILKAPEPKYGGDTVWVTGYALDNFTHEHLLGITVRARAAKEDTAANCCRFGRVFGNAQSLLQADCKRD